jgi:hypothetical protein
MRQPDPYRNDVFLDLLSSVIDALDPVPPAAHDAAHAAGEMSYADQELAALVENAVGEEALLLADESESTILTFRAPRLTIEIEIYERSHVVGALTPPATSVVHLEVASNASSGQDRAVSSDELGRFRIQVERGLTRLRIGSGPNSVVTSWFYC